MTAKMLGRTTLTFGRKTGIQFKRLPKYTSFYRSLSTLAFIPFCLNQNSTVFYLYMLIFVLEESVRLPVVSWAEASNRLRPLDRYIFTLLAAANLTVHNTQFTSVQSLPMINVLRFWFLSHVPDWFEWACMSSLELYFLTEFTLDSMC